MQLGDIHGSAFSIGGTNHTNTVHHGGTGAPAPGVQELLEAVLDLRAALVRLPRGTDRSALDAALDGVAEDLEGAEAIRPGLVNRLRTALERWAPLVESVSAATALAGLLASLGG
ncbi:FUSC family protein [Streptomyces sp. APSN-46.1]|uniref:FUSC family protein n=1 Tax=Streptomyces sp. APSN-46.1 TaxID=2929049 RepID=UPI001FB22D92|nr:FUSC family protein [Streptomyces sp. APSN-46.1]MCJ1679505.1 FUSC family protein [Streptomyces sp. APSN-46.1]